MTDIILAGVGTILGMFWLYLMRKGSKRYAAYIRVLDGSEYFTQMDRDQLTPDMPQLVRQAAGPDLPIARTPYIGHGTDAHAAVIGKFYQISSD